MSQQHLYTTSAAQQPAFDTFFTPPPPLPVYNKTKSLLQSIYNNEPVKTQHQQPDIIYHKHNNDYNAGNNHVYNTTAIQTSFITVPVQPVKAIQKETKVDNSTAVQLHSTANTQQLYIYLTGSKIPQKLQYITLTYNANYTVEDVISDIQQYTGITSRITLYRNTPWQTPLQLKNNSVLSEDLYVPAYCTLTASFDTIQPIGIFERTITVLLPSGVRINDKKTVQLTVQCTDSILQLKQLLYKLTHIPLIQQRVQYNKQILNDTLTVKQYNIQHNTTIQLLHDYKDVQRSDGRPQIESIVATHCDTTSHILPYTSFVITFAKQIGTVHIPKHTVDTVHLINVSCNGKLIAGTVKLSPDQYTVTYKSHTTLPINSIVTLSVNPALVHNENGIMCTVNNSKTFYTVTQAPIHLTVTSPQFPHMSFTVLLLRNTTDILHELKRNIAACLGDTVNATTITHIVHNSTPITAQQQIWSLKPNDSIRVALFHTVKPLIIDSVQYSDKSSKSSIRETERCSSIDTTDDDTQDSIDSTSHSVQHVQQYTNPTTPVNGRAMLVKLMSQDNNNATPFLKVTTSATSIPALVIIVFVIDNIWLLVLCFHRFIIIYGL